MYGRKGSFTRGTANALLPRLQPAEIFLGNQNDCNLLLYLTTKKRIGAFMMFLKFSGEGGNCPVSPPLVARLLATIPAFSTKVTALPTTQNKRS